MLKIFTTQLTGVLKKIAEEEEQQFEDASRLIAQTILSGGTIYFYGVKEFEAITLEAVYGEDRLENTQSLKEVKNLEEITSQDIVVIASRYATDEEAITLSKKLREQGVTVIGISSVVNKEEEPTLLTNYVEVHIDLKPINRLVPINLEQRIGYPISIAGLYAYFGLYLTTKEIIAEYEDDLDDY